MEGQRILVASLSVAAPMGLSRSEWQYHPRSDRHSKIACWGILYDLMHESRVLAKHVRDRKIVFGLNHEMSDFKTQRQKKLDLVIARPSDEPRQRTFSDLVHTYRIVLDADQQGELDGAPALYEGPVGSVLMALEAKACMTEHVKARPRLYDELNSSHLTVHGSSADAIAVGFVMVNSASTFSSPGRLGDSTKHDQPRVTERVIDKIHDLPRRTRPGEEGFDALGITVVDCANDGSPVGLVLGSPAPPRNDDFHYEQMVRRIAHLFDTRFVAV